MARAHTIPQEQYYVKNKWISFSYILQKGPRNKQQQKHSLKTIEAETHLHFMWKPETHSAVMHIALGYL